MSHRQKILAVSHTTTIRNVELQLMDKKPLIKEFIPNRLYFKIGEVSQLTGIEPYVLRYWESEFKTIKPSRTKSKQRIYRKNDIEIILEIKRMLYEEKLTIAGARKKLQELKSKGKKQLHFDFNSSKKDHHSILREIKEELKTIRKMLG